MSFKGAHASTRLWKLGRCQFCHQIVWVACMLNPGIQIHSENVSSRQTLWKSSQKAALDLEYQCSTTLGSREPQVSCQNKQSKTPDQMQPSKTLNPECYPCDLPCLPGKSPEGQSKARPEALWQAPMWQKIANEMIVMSHVPSQVSSTNIHFHQPCLVWDLEYSPNLGTKPIVHLAEFPCYMLSLSVGWQVHRDTLWNLQPHKRYGWTGIDLGEGMSLWHSRWLKAGKSCWFCAKLQKL